MEHAKERLEAILSACRTKGLPHDVFAESRFYVVFGNLIQEYLADRIWEQISVEIKNPTRSDCRERAIVIAERWFGQDFVTNQMPFTVEWLMKYLEGRLLGYLQSCHPEGNAPRAKRLFEERHSKKKCEWYLGCPLTEMDLRKRGETLQCDHKWPLSIRGHSSPDDMMWLCRKHNVLWKGKTVFWGENFIPCGKYLEEDHVQ